MPCTDHWAVNSQVYAETCGILSKFFSYFCFMPHSAHTHAHTTRTKTLWKLNFTSPLRMNKKKVHSITDNCAEKGAGSKGCFALPFPMAQGRSSTDPALNSHNSVYAVLPDVLCVRGCGISVCVCVCRFV